MDRHCVQIVTRHQYPWKSLRTRRPAVLSILYPIGPYSTSAASLFCHSRDSLLALLGCRMGLLCKFPSRNVRPIGAHLRGYMVCAIESTRRVQESSIHDCFLLRHCVDELQLQHSGCLLSSPVLAIIVHWPVWACGRRPVSLTYAWGVVTGTLNSVNVYALSRPATCRMVYTRIRTRTWGSGCIHVPGLTVGAGC